MKRPQQQREGERVLDVRPRCSPHRKTWILTQWGFLIAFTSSSGAARSPDDGWCVLTGRWTSLVVAGHVRASGGVFALVRIHTCDRARLCVCAAMKRNLLSVGRASINNLTGKTNKPENMGCTGDTTLRFVGQTCLIAFRGYKWRRGEGRGGPRLPSSALAMPGRYSSRQPSILIVWSIDTHRLGSQHLPHLHPLCIDSYFSKHLKLRAPVTCFARPLIQGKESADNCERGSSSRCE